MKRRGVRKGDPRTSSSRLAATELGKSLSRGAGTGHSDVSQRIELRKNLTGMAFGGGPGWHGSERTEGRAGAQGSPPAP